MDKLVVSIIIINYKTYNDTKRCIDSIIKYTQSISYEIILVENGTYEFNHDNTTQWGDKVKLIISNQNLGFAGGNNLGLSYTIGEYVLLLNSDTYLTEDSISKSITFFKEQSQIGALTVRLVYPDGSVQSVAQRFPSIKYQLFELLRLQKILGKKISSKLLLGAFFDYNETTEADWIWGAYFLTKKEIIYQLPNRKFDDDYFMYWEDVQWCIDIKKLGYKIVYYADTTVVHVQAASGGKTNSIMLKSEQLFFTKNYSKLHFKLIKFLNRCLK